MGIRIATAVLVAGLAAWGARAEVIEEIVAWVNGEIITKSELEEQEEQVLAEIYRRFAGPQLDEQVARARRELLARLIDRKILLQKAGRLYDMAKMGGALIDSFKEQQKIKSDEDLQRLLAREGMTLEQLRTRLIEMYAPEEIIRFEVIGRLSVSDKEIQEYYDRNPEVADVPGEATLREIVLLAEGDRRQEARARAESIRERLAAPGSDFAAVAAEVSDAGTKQAGGLLAGVRRGDLAPALEAVAFTLPVGEVSPVLERDYGFHLLKVESRTEPRRRTVEEMKEDLRSRIEDEKYEKALEQFLVKARAESDIVVKKEYEKRYFTKKSGS